MSKPRYTDSARYRTPYVTAKASEEPNYLRDKFRAIREQLEKDAAEAKAKTTPIKRKTA
jgi:hypothetical protein